MHADLLLSSNKSQGRDVIDFLRHCGQNYQNHAKNHHTFQFKRVTISVTYKGSR